MSLRVKLVAMSFRVGSSTLSAEVLSISAQLTKVVLRSMAISYHIAILPCAIPFVEDDYSVYHWDHQVIHRMIGSGYRGERLVIPIRLDDVQDTLKYIVRYFRYLQA